MLAVVTGMIATFPVGGVAWDYGQYAVGLERLGFDVFYLEDSDLDPIPPSRSPGLDDAAYAVAFLEQSLRALSPALAERWHLRLPDGRTYGMDSATMADVIAGADVLLNVSGSCLLREPYRACRRKVLIDTDPGFTQFVQIPRSHDDACGPRAHDVFATYATALGDADCPLPAHGLQWHATRPPVVLDLWSPQPPGDTWTTVMSWGENYLRPVEHDGRRYGGKEAELRRIEELPERTQARLEIAVGGVDPPRARWQRRGWSVRDAHTVTHTAEDYRAYVTGSRGELSVAKNLYVATHSGWFSCRSVCYLAAGRPVVVQDTGFTRRLPHGEGLLAFSDLTGAVAALASVERDYASHAEAARAIAARAFDAELVLAELLEHAGVVR